MADLHITVEDSLVTLRFLNDTEQEYELRSLS